MSRTLLAAALLLALAAGCLAPANRRAVATYDLGPLPAATPAAQPVFSAPLQVLPLANLSAAQTKFMRRLSNQQVAYDEYHRWAQRPEALLTTRLYQQAAASGYWPRTIPPHGAADAAWRLTGSLLRCEYASQAVLELELTLEAPDGRLAWTRRFTVCEPAEPMLHSLPARDRQAATTEFAANLARAADRLFAEALAACAAAAPPQP
jgi:ABC-type uncharacterized transport system auxiliary subunit